MKHPKRGNSIYRQRPNFWNLLINWYNNLTPNQRFIFLLCTLIVTGGALAALSRNNVLRQTESKESLDRSSNFLTSCNSSMWHINNRMTFPEVYNTKMRVVQSPNHNTDDLSKKLLKAKHRIATILDEVREKTVCSDGCNYIDFVLTHPEFKIEFRANLNTNARALYRVTQHAIIFDLSVLETDSDDLYRSVLHEFWHAYKTLVHTKNQNPSKMNITKQNNPATGYNRSSNDALRRKDALQSAIDSGDSRILKDLPLLLKKEKNGSFLSSFQTNLLEKYKRAAESYIPHKHTGMLNSQRFQEHFYGLNLAVKKGNVYKYVFYRGSHELALYVTSFQKKSDGGAIIEGLSVPNKHDKLSALINDTKFRKYNLAYQLTKEESDNAGTIEETIFLEHDAHIAENGEIINFTFYPERDDFHRCEHNEVFHDEAMSFRM